MKVTTSVTGIDKAIANFEELKRGVRNRVLRKAVRAGCAPGVRAAKSASGQFDDDTGTLRKSFTTKVKTFSSGITTGIIGPRNRTVDAFSKTKKRTVRRNPNNYAHLIELGHRIAVSKVTSISTKDHVLIRRNKIAIATGKIEAKDAGQVAPRPFLLNSFNASKAQQLSELTSKLSGEIAVEVARLSTNG